jgi:hypothetical protein
LATGVIDRGDARAAMDQWPVGYYVDSLFRQPSQPGGTSTEAQPPAASTIATPSSNAAASAASSASAPALASPAPSANAAAGAVVSQVATPTLSATAAEPSAEASAAAAAGSPPKQEVTRIFLNSLATDDPLSVADTAYVARIVSRYTGLTPQAAQLRVAATYAGLQQKVVAIRGAAKVAADKARRGSVSASLWLFVSLLLGAFSASFMAIFGGRVRDV